MPMMVDSGIYAAFEHCDYHRGPARPGTVAEDQTLAADKMIKDYKTVEL